MTEHSPTRSANEEEADIDDPRTNEELEAELARLQGPRKAQLQAFTDEGMRNHYLGWLDRDIQKIERTLEARRKSRKSK